MRDAISETVAHTLVLSAPIVFATGQVDEVQLASESAERRREFLMSDLGIDMRYRRKDR